MKTCYTAIFGTGYNDTYKQEQSYDNLKEPTVPSPGWEFVCYTDQPITSSVWKIIRVEPNGDPQRQAREIKINFHKYVDTHESLWLDAAFQINIDLNIFWERYFSPQMSAPKHPLRNCIYQEARSCVANQRGDAVQIENQVAKYRRCGIPALTNNIISSGVLLRQKTEPIIELCEDWWKELSEHSVRDQLAFARVTLKRPINMFNWDYSQSRELKYVKHFKHRH